MLEIYITLNCVIINFNLYHVRLYQFSYSGIVQQFCFKLKWSIKYCKVWILIRVYYIFDKDYTFINPIFYIKIICISCVYHSGTINRSSLLVIICLLDTCIKADRVSFKNILVIVWMICLMQRNPYIVNFLIGHIVVLNNCTNWEVWEKKSHQVHQG